MARKLAAEERALWEKVIRTVRPLHPGQMPAVADPPVEAPISPPPPRAARQHPAKPIPPARPGPGTTLDASWDRRLSRGLVQPEMSVDLHGHDLAGAYGLLDRSLEQAVERGVRVLLLVTGKPPKGEPPVTRGRIRAAVGDWLGASRHAGSIAAVRNAHPRHGGTGALYIILRRLR